VAKVGINDLSHLDPRVLVSDVFEAEIGRLILDNKGRRRSVNLGIGQRVFQDGDDR
jgi:hypothetical protein